MRRTILAALGLVMGLAGAAYGMGSNLDQPSIAIPTNSGTKQPDAVARKIFDVLWSHRKNFTGGSFLNSTSELYFGGGVDGVNALLADLAKVDGVTLRIRLSKEAGLTRWMFPKDAADRPCDCRIDHFGWGDPHVVTFTIYLSGGRIDPDKIELPVFAFSKNRAAE